MHLNILLFGITREMAGHPCVRVELPDQANVAQLRQHLEAAYPQLRQLASVVVAVNEEYAQPDRVLQPTDEVALIPPVSGG